MFGRSALRSAPLATVAPSIARTSTRKYATASPPQQKGISWIAVGSGAAAAAAAYYLYRQYGKSGLPGSAIGKAEQVVKKEGIPTLKGDGEWTDLKLIEVIPYNHNTKRFRFALPSEEHSIGLKTASAILTKFVPQEGAGKPVIRPYTPVSEPTTHGHVDLLVKRYDKGPMSEHIHSMAPNQRLSFKGPIPKYAWEPNKHDAITLIAGGTGITPMWQLAQEIFDGPNAAQEKTKVILVFANRSEEDILLKEEFERLENTYPQRFRAFYVLENAPKEWRGSKGYITEDLLKTVLPEPGAGNNKIFVCGPPPMYKAVSGGKNKAEQGELSGILKKLGYKEDDVFKF